jgi:hypothetical protein
LLSKIGEEGEALWTTTWAMGFHWKEETIHLADAEEVRAKAQRRTATPK